MRRPPARSSRRRGLSKLPMWSGSPVRLIENSWKFCLETPFRRICEAQLPDLKGSHSSISLASFRGLVTACICGCSISLKVHILKLIRHPHIVLSLERHELCWEIPKQTCFQRKKRRKTSSPPQLPQGSVVWNHWDAPSTLSYYGVTHPAWNMSVVSLLTRTGWWSKQYLNFASRYASGGELFDYIVAKGRVPELEAWTGWFTPKQGPIVNVSSWLVSHCASHCIGHRHWAVVRNFCNSSWFSIWSTSREANIHASFGSSSSASEHISTTLQSQTSRVHRDNPGMPLLPSNHCWLGEGTEIQHVHAEMHDQIRPERTKQSQLYKIFSRDTVGLMTDKTRHTQTLA